MASIFDEVVDQGDAIAALRAAAVEPVHAYVFVGPPGSTKHRAAQAFATLLLTGSEDPTSRDAGLVRVGEHPDVREIAREGAAISFEQAREIVRMASMAPFEGDRKVMILHEFHLLRPDGAALLLKTIEEPPDSTVFIVLADFLAADLVTVASRCVRIGFRAISTDQLTDRLVLEGADPESARQAAEAAGGDLDRARILAGDPDVARRRRAFAEIPLRIDGTGSTVIGTVEELLALIEASSAPLVERHRAEIVELDARIARFGERGSGRKALEERHKRELRRHRTDELRLGLAATAAAYRDGLIADGLDRRDTAASAVARLHAAIGALDRNVNEALLLQSLLWSLPPAHAPA